MRWHLVLIREARTRVHGIGGRFEGQGTGMHPKGGRGKGRGVWELPHTFLWHRTGTYPAKWRSTGAQTSVDGSGLSSR